MIKHIAFFAAFALGFPAIAQTADEIAGPPLGLFILKAGKTAPGEKRLYGPTSAGADYAVAQWSIPENLPPFQNNATQNQYASVVFHPGSGFDLYQDGTYLACNATYAATGATSVREFDLVVSPRKRPWPATPLGGLAHVYVDGAVTIHAGKPANTPPGAACKLVASTTMIAVVMTDKATRPYQIFYYQLHLINFGSSPAEASMHLGAQREGFFWTGNDEQSGSTSTFGWDANSAVSFGLVVPADTPTAYHLDLLPALETVIGQGAAHGMDQNLSDWKLTGYYVGGSIWGATTKLEKWSNPTLRVVPAD